MSSPEVEPTEQRPTPQGEPAALRCPLCEYDVRGLPEPRCPECGHRFEWEELTDPSRQRVRWLFEHRRWLAGWISTHLRLARWWRFWGRDLRPAHRLEPWRVLLFWAVGLVPVAAANAGVTLALAGIQQQNQSLRLRARLAQPAPPILLREYPAVTPLPKPTQADVWAAQSRMTVPQYLDRYAPLWNSPVTLRGGVPARNVKVQGVWWSPPGVNPIFWAQLTSDLQLRWGWSGSALAAVAVMPLSGLLVLGVMRQSFARVKVRPGHAVRVAVYSADALPVVAVGAAAAASMILHTLAAGPTSVAPMMAGGGGDVLFNALTLALIVTTILWLVRLECGVRRYLGVPHAWAAAVVSGVVALLLWGIVVTATYTGR